MQTEIKPWQLLNILLVAFPILCLCVVTFRVVMRNAEVVYPSSETESDVAQSLSRLPIRSLNLRLTPIDVLSCF